MRIPNEKQHDFLLQPDKREERARIEARGGRVVFTDGARVEGVLSMSRAIGNCFFLLESMFNYYVQ